MNCLVAPVGSPLVYICSYDQMGYCPAVIDAAFGSMTPASVLREMILSSGSAKESAR